MSIIMMSEQMKSGINFYIVHPCLDETLQEYLEQRESDITPNTEEFLNSYDKRIEYKQKMNVLVKEMVTKHNIYWYQRPSKPPIKIEL